jgi:hypothetical protein
VGVAEVGDRNRVATMAWPGLSDLFRLIQCIYQDFDVASKYIPSAHGKPSPVETQPVRVSFSGIVSTEPV